MNTRDKTIEQCKELVTNLKLRFHIEYGVPLDDSVIQAVIHKYMQRSMNLHLEHAFQDETVATLRDCLKLVIHEPSIKPMHIGATEVMPKSKKKRK